jgi:hypothetical protein
MNDKSAASSGEPDFRRGSGVGVDMSMTLALHRGWAPLDARARHSVTAWLRLGAPVLLLVRGLHGLAVDLDDLLGDVLGHVLVAI